MKIKLSKNNKKFILINKLFTTTTTRVSQSMSIIKEVLITREEAISGNYSLM